MAGFRAGWNESGEGRKDNSWWNKRAPYIARLHHTASDGVPAISRQSTNQAKTTAVVSSFCCTSGAHMYQYKHVAV